MAGVGMLVGGALVNALAFSGSNYLFSRLHSSDAVEEQRRHDKAVEQLQAAHTAWSERRSELLDWRNEELRRQRDAEASLMGGDASMREYARVHGYLEPEPQLSDFYQPSEGQKGREIAFVAGAMALTSFVAYRLLL